MRVLHARKAGLIVIGVLLLSPPVLGAGTLLLPAMSEAARKAIERKNEVQKSEKELTAAAAEAVVAATVKLPPGVAAAAEEARARLATQLGDRLPPREMEGPRASAEVRCFVQSTRSHAELSGAVQGRPELRTVILRVGSLLEKDTDELASEKLAVQFQIVRWSAGEKSRTVIRLIDINTESGIPAREVSLESLGLTAWCDGSRELREPREIGELKNAADESALASRNVKPAPQEPVKAEQERGQAGPVHSAGSAQ